VTSEATATIRGQVEYQGGYGPPVIRVTAVGLSALARASLGLVIGVREPVL